MISTFSTSTILFLLGCLLLGFVYAVVLYRQKGILSIRPRITYVAIRTILVAMIAFLLFAPMLKFTNYRLQKPVIIIGQDNSTSIKQVEPKGFDNQSYQRDLIELQKKLAEKFDVQTFYFGEKVGEGFDFSYKARTSNVSELFSKIKTEYSNRNVGAVILATDGIFNQGANPSYGIQNLRSPVYAIALGDTIPKRDALLTNINYNNIVYLDDTFTIEVQVKVFDGDGQKAELSLVSKDKVLQKQLIDVKGNVFVKTISLKVRANTIGLQKFTVQIAPLVNEITTKNNSQTIYVEVINGSKKILLAAAAPHPDIAVLKEAIASNKHFEVSLALADKLNTTKPKDFDAIILYQLPGAGGLYKPFLTEVMASRKPLWFIIGGQTNLPGFNAIQNLVNIGAASAGLQEVYPVINQNFTTFNLAPNVSKVTDYLDPLLMPFGKLTSSPNINAILNQRIGRIDAKLPLLFFDSEDGRKVGFLMGEGIWRWKLNEAQAEDSTGFVRDLVSKTIQFLAVKDDKRRFKIIPSKSSYQENEEVTLNATYYNQSYQPSNEPEATLVLKDDKGKTFNYVFSKSEIGYELKIRNLPTGNYTFTGLIAAGKEKLSATGGFYVTAVLAEYEQTTADHKILQTMATQTGGKMVMPSHLLALIDAIDKNENVKTVSYEDRSYVELINLKVLFFLILALLSLEWFLRKRNGEV